MAKNPPAETLCDRCNYREYKGVIVWGREPNEAESKLNETLKAERKEYFCSYFERYFNRNFPKRKYHCEVEGEEDEEHG